MDRTEALGTTSSLERLVVEEEALIFHFSSFTNRRTITNRV